ncbi:MAG: hypothetical protein B6226_03565 [Candidatus Cloacimonetes bacterium 4572_65]|nr:MAG: hypothetical protein B6226_03565 [Candidatus Cloacimonetes bacterium 4572_65]
MRKLITLVLSIFLFACSTNSKFTEQFAKVDKVDGAVKIAILPLEKLDSESGYIKKIMELRDIELLFGSSEKFVLVDNDATAEVFADLGDDISVEELEKDEITDMGNELGADVVITGTIESVRGPIFDITYTLFSMRTGDVSFSKVRVSKYKEDRLATLEDKFMGKISEFVDNEMKKLLAIAIQNYNIKNYDLAQESFENIKRINPDLKDTDYYLGLIALKQEQYDIALNYFDVLVAQDTTGNIDYLDKQAKVYIRQGMIREATVPTRKIVEIKNGKDDWLLLADLYASIDDLTRMEESIAKAIEIDSLYDTAIYRYANVLFDSRKYSDAITYLESAVSLFPDDEIIANNLVAAYQQTGQISQAIANYEKIIKKDKTNINAKLNLAGMYLAAASDATKANKLKTAKSYKSKARKVYASVIKVDKTNGIVYTRLATLYLGEKNFTKAAQNAEKAKQYSPNNYAPFLLLSQIKQTLAIEKFQAALKFNREIPKATGSKAEALANKRDEAKESAGTLYRETEENLNKALKINTKPNVARIIEKRLTKLRELTEKLETSF